MNVNLGCGWDKINGFVNVDISSKVNPDVVADLNKKLPFKSGSVDFIICKHTIEHLNDPIAFIEECWRILKPGARIEVIAPHYSRLESLGELQHKRAGLSVFSFHYCTHSPTSRNYYSKSSFSIEKVSLVVPKFLQWFANLSPIKYEKFFSRLIGAKEITFILVKKQKIEEVNLK